MASTNIVKNPFPNRRLASSVLFCFKPVIARSSIPIGTLRS